MLILSHIQAKPLLDARAAGTERILSSPDLGLTDVPVTLTDQGAIFDNLSLVVRWEELAIIAGATNVCFSLDGDGGLCEIKSFSQTTQWVRSLYPTTSAPTTLVAGLTMHRIVGSDPLRDTLAKVKAVRPTGRVLDTATGLGYTAIEAARTAEHVVTVEIDPDAIEIARLNPWSSELFDNARIEIVVADVAEYIKTLKDGVFSCVLHDPPAFVLAGDLYAAEFYREFFRILRPRGRLFHYIGDPESKAGQRIWQGVIRRLHAVGFSRVESKPRAFGVVAFK